MASKKEEIAAIAAAEAQREVSGLTADLSEAEKRKNDAAWLLFLAEKREARAKEKNVQLHARIDEAAPRTCEWRADEWAALSREAAWKAHQRERARISAFLSS